MADRQPRRLQRLLRVRALQLDTVRAQERAAGDHLASETALGRRIAELSAGVAPMASPTPTAAGAMLAAAQLRERLHMTAAAVERRVAVAETGLARAQAVTREARRDHLAMEKLLERARAEAIRRDMRALEDAPARSARTLLNP